MTKFHIKRDGTPGICHAKEGHCPLGGINEHYNSWEEANAAIQADHEEKYANNMVLTSVAVAGHPKSTISATMTLPANPKFEETLDPDKNPFHDSLDEGLPEMLFRLTSNKPKTFFKYGQTKTTDRGTIYEHAVISDYIQKNKVNNLVVYNKKGKPTVITTTGEKLSEREKEDLINQAERMNRIFVNKNINDGNEVFENERICDVIAFNDDKSRVVAHMGGQHTTDVAYMTDGEVSFSEVKSLNGSGAQIGSVPVELNSDNTVNGDLSFTTPEIANKIKELKVTDAIGHNQQADLSEKESLQYFVDYYKRNHPAEDLEYIDSHEPHHIRRISLQGDTDAIVNRLYSNGIKAKILLRTNQQTPTGVTDKDIQRFKMNCGNYFKHDTVPDRDYFTLSDLNKPCTIRKCNSMGKFVTEIDSSNSYQYSSNHKYLAIGDLCVPVSKEEIKKIKMSRDFNFERNHKFYFSDCDMRRSVITGTIQHDLSRDKS